MRNRIEATAPAPKPAMGTNREEAIGRRISRRRLLGDTGSVATATAIAFATGGFLTLDDASAIESPTAPLKDRQPTPERTLVDNYNTWFSGAFSDMPKLRAGLPRYITNETILNEPVSTPWGGTMVGYEGWVHFCQLCLPIFVPILTLLNTSEPTYYQHANVVLHETTFSIKPSSAAPTPFSIKVIGKYTVARARIQQIDMFWQDTAALLDRLSLLGAIPSRVGITR